MRTKFPGGFDPPKRISREAMNLIRSLHAGDPETYTTPVLAEEFKISSESVRRILKSKFVKPVERKSDAREVERSERAELLRRWEGKEQLVSDEEERDGRLRMRSADLD